MQEESIIKECDYFNYKELERNLMGLNSFIKPQPIMLEECKHPLKNNRKFTPCNTMINEWCPFFGLTNEDRD